MTTNSFAKKLKSFTSNRPAGPDHKQHVDMFRKVTLRRKLLEISKPQTIYVPFIGDGDLAALLYSDMFIYGADIDPNRVSIASSRLHGSIVQADCNGWPFPGITEEFNGADFDSYSYPYDSFRSWWNNSKKANRLTLFFTDGQRKSVVRKQTYIHPSGEHCHVESTKERTKLNLLWLKHPVLDWFEKYILPYRIQLVKSYRRGFMIYWGAIITNEK